MRKYFFVLVSFLAVLPTYGLDYYYTCQTLAIETITGDPNSVLLKGSFKLIGVYHPEKIMHAGFRFDNMTKDGCQIENFTNSTFKFNMPGQIMSSKINGNEFEVTLGNIEPNTEYCLIAFIYAGGLRDYRLYPGNFITFKTPPLDAIPITNNVIDNQSKDFCLDNGIIPSLNLTGGHPAGGHNGGLNSDYQYTWQLNNGKTISPSNWANAPGTNNQESYTAAAWADPINKDTVLYYRRIVVSGEVKDTSSPVRFAYYLKQPNRYVTIFQSELKNNQAVINNGDTTNTINVKAELSDIKGDFYTQWFAATNADPTVFTEVNLTNKGSGTYTITSKTPTSDNSTVWFKAVVSASKDQTTCSETSQVFGISPPTGDGLQYLFTKINSNYWFINNLRSVKFINGEDVQQVQDDDLWIAVAYPAFSWRQEMGTIIEQLGYGAYYNYKATINSSQICPSGWHVSSSSDWADLIALNNDRSTIAHKMLFPNFWPIDPSFIASNPYNFNAFPNGFRNHKTGKFEKQGKQALFWQSEDVRIGRAYQFERITESYLLDDSQQDTEDTQYKYKGAAIRCVKKAP